MLNLVSFLIWSVFSGLDYIVGPGHMLYWFSWYVRYKILFHKSCMCWNVIIRHWKLQLNCLTKYSSRPIEAAVCLQKEDLFPGFRHPKGLSLLLLHPFTNNLLTLNISAPFYSSWPTMCVHASYKTDIRKASKSLLNWV